VLLDSSGPASLLTSEPHSFSRVFTGAFLDAIAGMLLVLPGNQGTPTDDQLLQVSEQMGDILVAGVRNASVVANFYSQVAGGMVRAAGQVNPAFLRPMKAAFVKRGILSLHSATSVETLANAAMSMTGAGPGSETDARASAEIAIDGKPYGLGDVAVIVETPSQPRKFAASSAINEFAPVQVPSSEAAARVFVEQLFRQGRVDLSGAVTELDRIDPLASLKTHRLVKAEGALRLERVLCDCGLKHD